MTAGTSPQLMVTTMCLVRSCGGTCWRCFFGVCVWVGGEGGGGVCAGCRAGCQAGVHSRPVPHLRQAETSLPTHHHHLLLLAPPTRPDDEEMGWARYAHSMRVFVFNSGLFYIRYGRSGRVGGRVDAGEDGVSTSFGEASRAMPRCALFLRPSLDRALAFDAAGRRLHPWT